MDQTQGDLHQQGSGNMPQQSEHEMIETIVNGTNQILGTKYSLVDFDELTNVQLLQTLSDIFGSLAPQARVDFQQEPLDQGAARMIEFLTKTLNYKVPMMIQRDFPMTFARGEKTVVYPVLYWVLKRMPENAKRVYLARFLARVEIPEDLRVGDEGVRDVYNHYEGLRNEFIQVHKRVEALKEANADPAEARRKIGALESERDRLNTYIQAAQKKLSGVASRDTLLNSCKQLRQAQDDNVKLRDKQEELQQQLLTAQKRDADISSRLREVERDMHESRPDQMLQRMRDEIQLNTMKLQDQLPQQLNEARVYVAALQKLNTESVDLGALHAEQQQLDREIGELRTKVSQRQKPSEDGTTIAMMKQQVQRSSKKKGEYLQELTNLHQENQRYVDECREKEEQIAQFRKNKVLKGEDFQKFRNQVRSKTAAFKTMKARLSDLKAEWGVLDHTQELLKSKLDNLQEFMQKLESERGVSGYTAAQEQIAKMAEQKNIVENAKGKTLEELSKVVQEIVNTIRDRRNKLAPQIIELRNTRQKAQVVEQEFEEKRSAFEYQESLMMQEVNKLESEVSGLSEEVHTNESLFHRLNCQLSVIEAQTKRAEDEKDFRLGTRTLSATSKTYSEMFFNATSNLEARTKELQRRRRDIEENHDLNLQQVEWFSSLRKLLDAKVTTLKKQGEDGPGAAVGLPLDAEIQAAMNQTGGGGKGVDMLVLPQN